MEQALLKQRESFNAVDVAKFILAFCVVSIHTFCAFFDNPFINSVIDSVIIRLGVPFFFTCSGFFFFRDIVFENGRIKKTPENRKKLFSFLKRILILYVLWTLIYMVWYTYVGIFKNGFSLKEIIIGYAPDLFLDGVANHFWYLVFMMYGMILLYLALRFIRIEIVGVVIGALFLVFLYGYTYSDIFGTDFLLGVVDNLLYFDVSSLNISIHLFSLYISLTFLFTGLVCVGLREKITLSRSGILALVFLCLSIAENMIYRGVLDKRAYSYTIFFVPIALFGFLFLSKIKLNGNGRIFSFFRKSSTIIYCSHYLIKDMFNYLTDKKYGGTLWLFLVVGAASFGLSALIVLLSKKLKFLKKLY